MVIESLFDPQRILAAIFIGVISVVVYRLFLHPLSHIPGPFIARLTSIWLYRLSYYGIEASTIDELHKRYGPVVRIAPNEVDIADGTALQTVYVKNGGYLKNPCYKNFDIDGFSTIFSALSPAHRAVRSKAVITMFAPAAIRDGKDVICGCVDRMVDRLEREKAEANGKPVNVLGVFRSLALDAVTAYLFSKPYNGIAEQKLSASEFVDSFVAVGRFFYLPNWIFKLVDLISARMDEGKLEVWKSITTVDRFTTTLVDDARAKGEDAGQTYQARLLQIGISREETIAQCKDLMFAGTDSTGMNLSTICFHLVQHPEKYDRLRKEILDNSEAEAQTLPYLSGVVKEGLRISMANPTRLPRVVAPGGLHIPGLPSIPASTSVGLSAYTLHFNPDVFPNPQEFVPERWLEPTPEMLRDSIPFGIGPRQCIARTLATAELYWGVEALVRKDVLRGAKPVGKKIEIVEWFNSKVKKERIELIWD